MQSTFRLIVLGVALSLTGCGQSLGALSGRQIAKRLKASTVLVKTDGGHGTAFFVRGKSELCTLVTAAHVVLGKEVVRLQTADGKEREPLQILPFDRDLDLAAMTFAAAARCAYPPLKLGDSDGVEELDVIYISGFPGRSGGEPFRQTIPTVVTGFGNLPQGYGIGYKGELYGGMSGGPVLDRKGRVVAVHGLSDRRLLEIYDAQRQANLLPAELATVRQAEERVRSGVVAVNTFKWGIPINLYLRNRPAMVVPDGAGISSTFAWFLFGSGAVAVVVLMFSETVGKVLVGLIRSLLLAGVAVAGVTLVIHFGPTGWQLVEDWMQYRKLRDFLAAQQFRGADEETWRVMLQVAGREKEGLLERRDVDDFPCDDLRTIDRLWLKYSDGRFGFSVQKEIYQELDGTREYDEGIWRAFGDRVGWRQGGNWLDNGQLNDDKTTTVVSPPGHLPNDKLLRFLLSRAKTCNL